MKHTITALLGGVAFGALTIGSIAHAAEATEAATAASNASGTALQEVVVTARRASENLQTVPVAVSVVRQEVFDSHGAFSPQELQDEVPGLAVAATISDRNNLTYTIRGQGYAYGTLFPAVVTYFNEVPITQLSTGQFFDLTNVQVLRGPQGVLFGRVTDGGNIMITPQHPTNNFEGYVETKLGDYGLRDFTGALNIPVVSDKLMIRGAFDINRRDGFTTNIYNGENLDNVSYESGRIGVTWRPTDKFENYAVAAYQSTHDNGTGIVVTQINPLAVASSVGGVIPLFPGAYGLNSQGDILPYAPGLTPLTVASYVASVQARLALQKTLGPREVDFSSPSFDRRKNFYLVDTATYQITPDITFKNVFGYTNVVDYEASNYSGVNGGLVLTCHSACGDGAALPFNSQEQISEEFRFSGKTFDHKLSWSLGAYFDVQRPGENFENDTTNVGLLKRIGVQYAHTTSKAGFAEGEYDASSLIPGLKITGGVRYTSDTAASYENTYLEPIPSPLAAPALASFLENAEGLPAGIANEVANATVSPAIPYGQCVNFAPGSLFNPASGSPCSVIKKDFHAFTWTGGASYQLPSGQLVYAKVSRGYRPGGINGTAPAEDPSAAYQPEYDTSVEIGFKGDFTIGDANVRTNLAAYHDRYTGIQKNVVEIGAGGVPDSITANVDSATIQGVEFEGTLIPVRGLTLGANASYTDSHFDYINTSAFTVGGQPADPCNPADFVALGFCSSNRFNNAPVFQVGLTANYVLPLDEAIGEVSFGGRFYHQSSTALIDTSALNPDAIQAPYSILDLNALWHNPMGAKVDITFFITNVTNKLYRMGDNSLSQNSSVGSGDAIYAPPRMFGFGFKYRFGAAS